MFWGFGGPSLSGITANLKKEKCVLEEILSDPALSQALRNSLRELITFISRENILNDLIDWVLTDKHKDDQNCKKLTRNALSILTSNSQQVIKAISNQESFVQRIQSFIDQNSSEESISDAKIGGHFQRILEHFVRQTNGKLLYQLTNLPTFLIHNMSILGLRELFILMTTDFNDQFDLIDEDVMELSKKAITENGYFVTTAIKSILQQKPKSVIKYFQNAQVVKNLLEAAIETTKANHPLITTELYQTLNDIVKYCTNKPDLEPLLEEYGNKFIAENAEVNCSTASAISLFQTFNRSIFDHLFAKPVNTFLNQSIIKVLEQMDIHKRDTTLKDFNAISSLQQHYTETTVNGQLYELYRIIKQTYNLSAPSNSTENKPENPEATEKPAENEKTTEEQPKLEIQLPDGWNELSAIIEAELKIQEEGYGGPLPKEPIGFSSDSDNIDISPSNSDEYVDDEEDDSYDKEKEEEEEEEEAPDDKSDEEPQPTNE